MNAQTGSFAKATSHSKRRTPGRIAGGTAIIVSLWCAALPAQADILYASSFAELSSAINIANANPNSTIYLAPGTYSGGELPNILASLTISLDPASGGADGSAILNTTPTGSKGILTIPSGVSDVNLTVNGLTFLNATISAAEGGNAAGIRDQSAGNASLLVTNSTFIGNQNGILTGHGGALSDELLAVSISNSLFANNGAPDGSEHGIYIFGQSLDVTGSTFCGTIGGHDIKSRTSETTVTASSFYDGIAAPNPICGIGSASYSVDIPNGGNATLDGNLFVQGAGSPNSAIVSYGEEGLAYAANSFVVANNVFESMIGGIGIQELANGVATCLVPIQLSNNSFSSTLRPVVPAGCVSTQTDPGTTPVDEPSSFWLLAAALTLMLAWYARNPRE